MAVRLPGLHRLTDGVVVPIRLTPNASRDAIEGWRDAADGNRRLAVRVTAVPEKGKANAALQKLLAKALGVPKSAVSVQTGATSRQKDVRVQGDPDALTAALEQLTAAGADA